MSRGALVAVLAILGAAIGVGLTLAAGTVCVDRSDDQSFCGLNFLVWNLSTPVAIVLATALGSVVGIVLGVAASHLFSSN
jgi:uncharacterized membrane protein